MSGLDKEQIKKKQKLIRKKIRDMLSGRYPYVPPKPERKPKLNDYGLTENLIKQNKLKKEQKYKDRIYTIRVVLLAILGLAIFNDPFYVFIAIIIMLGVEVYKPLLYPDKTEIDKLEEQYQIDCKNWEWWTELFPKKKVPAYWFDLTGYEFEKELAEVFIANGYEAHLTSKSNDGGVDIVLKDDFGDKIYVQCKAYKNKAGVAVIRELYGVMINDNVNYGIVACLGGFTSGAEDFARDKNIKLISVRNIINMIQD